MDKPLAEQLDQLRRYFHSGATKNFAFRQEQLRKLKGSVLKYEEELYEALHTDLKKNKEEAWVTETGLALAEIRIALKKLKKWMRPQRVATNLVNLPSSSRIIKEPLGVVLIIAPWNYPVQLLLMPLIGAIAAGNCVVVKPSEFTPATTSVLKKLIEEIFPPEYVLYAEGEGQLVIPAMMQTFRFDHIFFTGSTQIGRIIYKMAAEKLTPVTLELGGKTPCVVEEDAGIKVAAKRIVMPKFSNAGQMCVAPDYILVHASRKEELVQAMIENMNRFYGDKPEQSYNYGKIINEKQFDRLTTYLSQGKIIKGGRTERSQLFIEPTLLEDADPQSPVMQEEIFGPILPILIFQTKEEALQIIQQHPDPLAFYIFTGSKTKEKEWLSSVAFGGGCVNNASWHLTNHHLPFGGRGFSGSGQYHGKYSFDTFSHKKSVMKTPTWFDPAIRYPPLKGKLKLFKWIIR